MWDSWACGGGLIPTSTRARLSIPTKTPPGFVGSFPGNRNFKTSREAPARALGVAQPFLDTPGLAFVHLHLRRPGTPLDRVPWASWR